MARTHQALRFSETTFCLLCGLLLCLTSVALASQTRYLLSPILEKNIGSIVPEPSGITFCNTTKHLYAICDKPRCHYIYELSLDGHLVQKLEFNKASHDDIEAVACDDKNKLLYIVEEGKRKITAYKLNEYQHSSRGPQLKMVRSFTVPFPQGVDPASGFEGLTVLGDGHLLAANEKSPGALVEIDAETGKTYGTHIVKYAHDYSDLEYDAALDMLWVLSDQSETLYLTDKTGTIVYDFWSLPIDNPEGVAVDNYSDPPRIYIVTDPSSPQGKQYLPIFYVFLKPELGQGNGYKHIGPSPTPSIPCKGCSTVELELVELRKQEAIAARRMMIVNVSVWVMVALSASFLILAILAGMVYMMNIAIRSKMGIIDSADDADGGEEGNNNNKKKKASQKKKKKKKGGYSVAGDGEFEMDVFQLADDEDEDEIALVVREDSSESDPQPQSASQCSVVEAPSSSSSSSSPSEVVVEVEYEGGHHHHLDNPEDAKETTNLLPPDASTGI